MPTTTRYSWKNKWALILYFVIASAALFYGCIGLLGLAGVNNFDVEFSKLTDPELREAFRLFSELLPNPQELAYLSELGVQNSRRVTLCQLGFNPFIAYYQLMLNPRSVVYSFHRPGDADEERLIYEMAASLPRVVPILGNPMHTIRAFVREFGINGAAVNQKTSMWEEYSEFSYAGDPRYKIRDLFIDEKTGVTCDIVYRSGGIVSELQLLALLSKQNTDVIYKPDEKDTSDWRGIIRTRDGGCKNNRTHCGYFEDIHESTVDIESTLKSHRDSLKTALAAVADSSNTIIWVPVGSAHQFFADALFCSFKRLNVSNYLFFAHDAAIHQYLLKRGRHSYYDNIWYTTMHGKQGYHDFAFNVVMRERFSVITDILDLGYNVLMNDADTLWLDDLLPDLRANRADIVVQMDQPTEKYFEVCTGFALYKNRQAVRLLLHKLQQISFYYPQLDDQELSNLVFKSKLSCLIWFNKDANSCRPGFSVSVQLKSPYLYVSGHLYCNRHSEWKAANISPRLIHLNGASPSKETCVANSNDWGYAFVAACN